MISVGQFLDMSFHLKDVFIVNEKDIGDRCPSYTDTMEVFAKNFGVLLHLNFRYMDYYPGLLDKELMSFRVANLYFLVDGCCVISFEEGCVAE